nr:RNA-directed DNA polymerase, eukaryota, reverse transcriptase zinc-binding domain protein [Tanacetum cinerariifolium]
MWAKISYINEQLATRPSPDDVYSDQKIVEVIKIQYDQSHGQEFIKEIIVRRADGKMSYFSKSDYKYLNKNDTEYLYLMCLDGKIKIKGPLLSLLPYNQAPVVQDLGLVRTPPLFNPSLDDILIGNFNSLSEKQAAKLFHAVCFALIWHIRGWRNKILHACSDSAAAAALHEDIFPSVQRMSLLWVSNRAFKSSFLWDHWIHKPNEVGVT